MDNINHPKHYHRGKYETIKVIDAWGLNFNLGNAVKYISRAAHKGSPLEDLKKARWYLNHQIRWLQAKGRLRRGDQKAAGQEKDRNPDAVRVTTHETG